MTRSSYNAPMNPISVDPEIMSGTPCFAGTRVPIKNLFDYLGHGHPMVPQLLQRLSIAITRTFIHIY